MAYELCSRKAYNERGNRVLRALDNKLLISADTLREELTKLTPEDTTKAVLTCNDWFFGGKRQYSGMRMHGDKFYRRWSSHSWGQALDLISKHYSADFLRKFILDNRDKFPYITRIEDGVNWLHIDTANLPANAPEGAIMLFNTKGNYTYV